MKAERGGFSLPNGRPPVGKTWDPWRIGDERGHESDDEEGEGMGGDRGGEIDDEGGSDGGEDTRGGDEQRRGNARQRTGGRGGRIIARAPMGLRLRWMIEGKGPPWAQR